jgi:hypothetical protein
MEWLGFDDNKKVGMGLLVLALAAYLLGVSLFFNRTFLLVGNLFFLAGIYFFVGFASTVGFFLKRGKRWGSGLYFGGFVLIVLRLALLGALVQAVGVFLMFRSFIPACLDALKHVPGLGALLESDCARSWLGAINSRDYAVV